VKKQSDTTRFSVVEFQFFARLVPQNKMEDTTSFSSVESQLLAPDCLVFSELMFQREIETPRC